MSGNSTIVINADGPETRVALIENGMLAELYIERKRGRGVAGNIYKGKVVRVLPGMQASERIKAMELAQRYGVDLYTGVFYRDPQPPPPYGAYVAERQATFGPRPERTKVLDVFKPVV